VTEPQLLDQRPVVHEIGALEVREEAPAIAHHLEQAATTVMVLRVRLEVLGERVDPLGEERT
jgi:hypothetical protein